MATARLVVLAVAAAQQWQVKPHRVQAQAVTADLAATAHFQASQGQVLRMVLAVAVGLAVLVAVGLAAVHRLAVTVAQLARQAVTQRQIVVQVAAEAVGQHLAVAHLAATVRQA